MDTVYPEPIRLKLGITQRRERASQTRYRTQPITFSEIKEVDEENENADEESVDLNRRLSAESSGPVMNSKSSSSVNAHFEELFARKRERKLNRRLRNELDVPKQQLFRRSPERIENTDAAISQPRLQRKKLTKSCK